MRPAANRSRPTRLVPDRPLPPYTHIPGRTLHPISDPRGHSFGVAPEHPDPPDPNQWQTCRPYLYGLDLFNHGYYWEAHEVWESIWHASGRAGRNANFLKGLIQLAVAGVKVREGRPRGVRTHARRAEEIFRMTATELGSDDLTFWGLRLKDLIRSAADVADHPPEAKEGDASVLAEAVFDWFLNPV
jgi:predicted metal-dependent hydrolase